jgi:hypothetical protein
MCNAVLGSAFRACFKKRKKYGPPDLVRESRLHRDRSREFLDKWRYCIYAITNSDIKTQINLETYDIHSKQY